MTDANWTASMQRYRRYICAPCWTKRQREFEASDPNSKVRRRESRRARESNWTEERKERERRRKRNNVAVNKYGIDLGTLDKMFEQQGHACAICGAVEPGGRGDFHIDHCHDFNVVRGLLCSACNLMIGMAKDRIDVLKSAIAYLTKPLTTVAVPHNRRAT